MKLRLECREVAAVDTGADSIQASRRDLVDHLDEHVRRISRGGGIESDIDEVRLFLQQELIPLVEAGESNLRPAVERVDSSTLVVSAMSLELDRIRRYVGDIEEIFYKLETGTSSDETDDRLAEKAIRLQAVVELYVAKELGVYLPALEGKLQDDERRQIMDALAAGRRVIKLPDYERV
jgi:hypothetical protein